MPPLGRIAWTPLVIASVGLFITAAVTWGVARTTRDRDVSRFDEEVSATLARIRDRIGAYEATLEASRALFAASTEVTHADFRRFVETFSVQRRYPGLQGIGFARWFTRAQLPALVDEERALGQQDFHVWPEDPPRDGYSAIVYLEPQDRRNRAAMGYDMFSDPARRDAMERSRDTGESASTVRVTLVQEIDEKKQAGFLIYLPVYSDSSAPKTLTERRAMLKGWVYAPFRADDLFAGILGNGNPDLSFSVYDNPRDSSPSHLLHVSAGPEEPPDYSPAFSREEGVLVAGREWLITFRTRASFDAGSNRNLVPWVAVIGMTVSGLLFLLSRAQVRSHRAALLARAEAEAERKKIEALADDLTRAVRVRDEFLSVAGHELKTPLAALMLNLQGLLRHVERMGDVPAHVLERLSKSASQVKRLEALVNELLDVSRITSGRFSLHREPLDLVQLVRDTIERHEAQFQRSGIGVKFDAPPALKGVWDRTRLDQVLTNLISNAIKYGAGKPIEVKVTREGDFASISVADHGIGISPEDRARIFGRFERAVSERNYGGLGLGLWISRQIVEGLGGRISCESEQGKGSTFTVVLPLVAASADAMESAQL